MLMKDQRSLLTEIRRKLLLSRYSLYFFFKSLRGMLGTSAIDEFRF